MPLAALQESSAPSKFAGMSSKYDASDFVDDDFQTARKAAASAPSTVPPPHAEAAPSLNEVETKVTEMHNKLAELKRAQQELERERTTLEELRRRQAELTTGRQEMTENLTRGVGLLEEAEFAARREAEQMSKALTGLREALEKVNAIQEDSWTKENLTSELARALTTIENARLEWNAARLKFDILNPKSEADSGVDGAAPAAPASVFQAKTYPELCKMGLALTWPLALVALAIFIALLIR